MTEADHVLELIRKALDEFDEAPLSASVRRAYRIARLLGESDAVRRLQLELVPLGGAKPDPIELARELWPEVDYDLARERNGLIVEEYIADRKVFRAPPDLEEQGVADGSSRGGSIAEIEHRVEELRRETDRAATVRERTLLASAIGIEQAVLGRVSHLTFSLLVRWERETTFSRTSSRIFDKHRARVDRWLGEIAPSLLDQFNSAYRRATDGDTESRALTATQRVEHLRSQAAAGS